jgi:serpin B
MKRIFLAVALVATLSGCAAAAPMHHTGPVRHTAGRVILTSRQIGTLRSLGAGDTAFGLELMAASCRAKPGTNVVLSPVSVASALGLAYLGARGATATVMAKVMHLPAGTSSIIEGGMRARLELLASLDRPGIVFLQSNRIWANSSLPPNPAYVAALRNAYNARLTHVPLLSNPELARQEINAAIAAATRGHISDLLPPGSLNDIGWVLTNALYLNARWATPFNAELTSPGSFHTASGQVTATYLKGGAYATTRYGGWAAAELPYRGNRLRMLALLPPASTASARTVGCSLPSAQEITAITAGLDASHATTGIALPKIKLSWQASLNQTLISLGMGLAFSSAADFSGISRAACCIGLVEHAATLAVAEKGTVASAATAVGIEPSSGIVIGHVLRFDRPYLLVIEDKLTGEPLMLAWVANPTA